MSALSFATRRKQSPAGPPHRHCPSLAQPSHPGGRIPSSPSNAAAHTLGKEQCRHSFLLPALLQLWGNSLERKGLRALGRTTRGSEWTGGLMGSPGLAFAMHVRCCDGGSVDARRQSCSIRLQSNCISSSSFVTPHQIKSKMPHVPYFELNKLCKEGRWKEAIDILDIRNRQGIQVTTDSYVCLLDGCANAKALCHGKCIHAHILNSAFELNRVLGTKLVNMYIRCGSMVDARKVFDSMPGKNVFIWTIMIAGYTQHGQNDDAFQLFWQMEIHGVKPDRVTFISILKACSGIDSLKQGRKIHELIRKSECSSDVVLRNTLIGMYARCGSIAEACHVFDEMHQGNVITWNTMIKGYVQCGEAGEAFKLFHQMKNGGPTPNEITFLGILKVCTTLAAVTMIHAHIASNKYEHDTLIATTLVDAYAKCGSIDDARKVFDRMPKRNVVSWTSMISGYTELGQHANALKLFRQMEFEGIEPNKVTFTCVLNACASMGSLEQGKQIHARVINKQFETDAFIGNALVDMYAKCKSLQHARHVFDALPRRDVVSWNAMIAGYVQHSKAEEALELFDQMKQEGIEPTQATFVSILKACASTKAFKKGKKIHAYVIERGLQSDVLVGSALVDLYAKCGIIKYARELFNRMLERNVVSWNAIITGYGHNGMAEEALQLFDQMKQEGIQPNEITFTSILKVCATVASLERGVQIHAQIARRGFGSDIILGNSLVHMYARCGDVKNAHQIFDKMVIRDLVSWNVLITGYAQQGHVKETLELLQEMQREGLDPDNITFIAILSACNHRGLIDEGRRYFMSMVQDYTINPAVEHYVCMADLLCRAGLVEEAADFIELMPFERSIFSWAASLSSSKIYGDTKLGKYASDHILDLQRKNTAAFEQLSKLYTSSGNLYDHARVTEETNINVMARNFGCSHIEVDHRVHMFKVEAAKHPEIKEIGKELKRLSGHTEVSGYVSDTRFVVHNVKDEETDFSSSCGSETLALVFGLISTRPGVPVRIAKNSQICRDSHTSAKLISSIVDREIVIRSANRFHYFRDGFCSCGDYW